MVRPRFISHRLSVEYLEMPKVACTSIKLALLAADGIQPTKYIDFEDLWLDPTPTPRFRFTFVRHPVTRFLSFYRDKVCTRNWHILFPREPRPDSPLQTLQWIKRKINTTAGDKHYLQQVEVRRRTHLPQPTDYIGRFESLMQEWSNLQVLYGLPPLPRSNNTQGSVTLTPACLELIWDVYEPDFRAFNYDLRGFDDASIVLAPDV